MTFRTCPGCGANLDPQEICDCRKGKPMYSGNPINDFLAHDDEQEEQEEQLAKLPRCADCGEHIQQESAVNIGGDLYCDSCLDAMRESIDVE